MLKPRALKSGDRIAVVSPASPFRREEFDAGVSELTRLGFEPVYDDSVFDRRGFVSGDPAARAAAIHRAWNDPSVAALIAVRGGYGSVQTLPLLDLAAARRARKAFIGYSDVTSLLTVLTLQCNLVAFHGPMLAGRLAKGHAGYDRQSFVRALTRSEPLGELAPPGLEALAQGEASGRLFGGTLSQIAASLGTPFAFQPPADSVLFLEDVGERPYRIDRMLTQLRLAGVLDRASAIVFGEFRACDEPDGQASARAVLAELAGTFNGPVLANFPSGHTTGPTWTLPLGVSARVIAGARARLVIEEAAVERS